MVKRTKESVSGTGLPAFQIIKEAAEGDTVAINRLLKHYERYITGLSMRCMYDEFGQSHYYVDETLRRRLETKLITVILKFKIQNV